MKQTKKAFSKNEISPAQKADTLLNVIRRNKTAVEKIEARYNKEEEALKNKYENRIAFSRVALTIAEQTLVALMKEEKACLFVGTDILKLENGSLCLLYTSPSPRD